MSFLNGGSGGTDGPGAAGDTWVGIVSGGGGGGGGGGTAGGVAYPGGSGASGAGQGGASSIVAGYGGAGGEFAGGGAIYALGALSLSGVRFEGNHAIGGGGGDGFGGGGGGGGGAAARGSAIFSYKFPCSTNNATFVDNTVTGGDGGAGGTGGGISGAAGTGLDSDDGLWSLESRAGCPTYLRIAPIRVVKRRRPQLVTVTAELQGITGPARFLPSSIMIFFEDPM